jgi:predicted DNA-binding transcriptional regulator AlpA
VTAPVATLDPHQVATLFKCSLDQLMHLLREKRAPLPVRTVEGTTRWFKDEIEAAIPAVQAILQRRRKVA